MCQLHSNLKEKSVEPVFKVDTLIINTKEIKIKNKAMYLAKLLKLDTL